MFHRPWGFRAGAVAIAVVATMGVGGQAEAFEQTDYITSNYCDRVPGETLGGLVVRAEGVGFLEIEWRKVDESTFHKYRPIQGGGLNRHTIELVLALEHQIVYRVTSHDVLWSNGEVLREGVLNEQSNYCS